MGSDNYPFIRYPHLTKAGHDEAAGFFDAPGEVLVFPKLDGANGCFWWDPEQQRLRAGSRNRELTLENDNHGMYAAMLSDPRFSEVAREAGGARVLYGEWLVSHTFKGYRPDAWRKFWVFDVYDRQVQQFLPHGAYSVGVSGTLDVVPVLATLPDGRLDDDLLVRLLESNRFLVADDCKEPGEGIVFKRYDGWKNRFGRVQWPKAVRGEFKDSHLRTFAPPEALTAVSVEQKIAEAAVTRDLVAKEACNAVLKKNPLPPGTLVMQHWTQQLIPHLLGNVYHCVVAEELWDQLKRLKSPTVDFKALNREVTRRVKAIAPELF